MTPFKKPRILFTSILLTLALGIAPLSTARESAKDNKEPRMRSDERPLRVLFIGNSCVSAYNLPGMIRQIADERSEPRAFQYETITCRRCTLQDHWVKGKAVEKIKNGNWDFVVLQEQSFTPVENKEMMFDYAKQFNRVIKDSGAKTVFYLTWSYDKPLDWMEKDDNAKNLFPEMPYKLKNAYLELAKELDAIVAPAGIAWELAREEHPDWKLYKKDGFHPSTTGAYLTAAVFYSTLYEKKPEDLPLKITPSGKRKTEIKVDDHKADAICTIAWNAIARSKRLF